MSKKKFTNTRLFKILRVILIIIVVILVVNIVINLTNKKSDELSLVIGDEMINLRYNLINEDGIIYISKDDIAKIYDENIYYNSNEEMLITTYNKHVAKLEVGKDTMEVNSEILAINGTLKEENGELYLPLLDMQDVYDFEYIFNEDDNVLILDSISKAKSQAVVVKNAKVKEEAKASSSTIEKLKKSDAVYVVVFEVDDDYAKIRTNAGNVGYIKNDRLSEIETLRDDMEDEGLNDVVILFDYNNISTYEVLESDDNCNIVIPNLLNINENLEIEEVLDLSSSTFGSYKSWAEESDVNIAATLTLSGSMNEVCSSYSSRTILINNICNKLTSNELRMVCIDFDDIDDQEGFYRFIIELTPRLKDNGYKILVRYYEGMNKERLENIVDYVVY